MDYQTPEIDGLTFAKKIREKYGDKKTIIFLTSYQEIVYDTFAVRVHRFLIKPVDKAKMFEALDAVIGTSNLNSTLSVKSDGKVEIIPIRDILYIEVADKECYICLSEDQIVCHKPISQLEDELVSRGFFRTHRTYLVNMGNIRSFDAKTIEFSNGETIPMSKRRYKEFCSAYLDFNG
jgi:DNA-binding LytR/AlgR family response regulator